jgi:hypothetical protein
MGKLTISMAIFNSYVSLPEDTMTIFPFSRRLESEELRPVRRLPLTWMENPWAFAPQSTAEKMGFSMGFSLK